MKTKQANIATILADGPDARAKGLTLLELIVAVALLSIMILTFGTVISSVDKMVTVGEANIRSNATAAAISQVIKNDFRRLSQAGFLCITQSASNAPGQAQIFFTTAGSTGSLTSRADGSVPPSGDGSVVGYGLVPGVKTLWRGAWIMNNCDKAVPAIVPGPTFDCLPLSFSDVQKMPRGLTSEPGALPGSWRVPAMDYYWMVRGIQTLAPKANADLPNITDVTQLGKSWLYMGQNCSNLSIMWTVDGVNWLGLKSDGTPVPPGPSGAWPGNWPTTPESTVGGAYFALWSHDNQLVWPKAVKITFNNNDPLLPADFHAVPYELICLVGK